MEKESRSKMLALALDNINSSFGAGSVMKMGDGKEMGIECIPSGSIKLDMALKTGGFPKGRIVEIFGNEASGKTTIALQAIASIQKTGGNAAFIDAEYAFNTDYAKKIGVDIEELYISQPDNAEEALDICEELVRSGAMDIIVIDSVSALVPRAEIESSMEDCSVGLLARLMGQAMRKLTVVLNHSDCIVIFVNQMRYNIYTGLESPTGGKALRYFSAIRLKVEHGEDIIGNKDIIGQRVNIRVVKNKVAPPSGECTLDIIFGKGVLHEKEILEAALEKGFIHRSGNHYYYDGIRIGFGEREAIQYLRDNSDVYEDLDNLLHGRNPNPKDPVSAEQDDEEDEYLTMLYEEEMR